MLMRYLDSPELSANELSFLGNFFLHSEESVCIFIHHQINQYEQARIISDLCFIKDHCMEDLQLKAMPKTPEQGSLPSIKCSLVLGTPS